MAVWVRLKSLKRISVNGRIETYHPGDWVEVGKHDARMWLADGSAEIMRVDVKNNVMALSTDGCGMHVIGGTVEQGREALLGAYDDLPVSAGGIELPYPSTLLWRPGTPLRVDLLPVGFHRLTTGWQVASPLYRYETLARDLGDDAARERTAAVIHDLRVPVYNTGLVYVRRCADTERLVELWNEEAKTGDDDRLCFMRALYRSLCVMCALPVTWTAGVV